MADEAKEINKEDIFRTFEFSLNMLSMYVKDQIDDKVLQELVEDILYYFNQLMAEE